MEKFGTVIIDDFHRLDDTIKERLSNKMKNLADREDRYSKLILIGINKAGQKLINFSHDLGLRVDIFRLESNPDSKIRELIELGEKVLNVSIIHKNDIVQNAQGSFQIAQLLSHRICATSEVTESQAVHRKIDLPLDVVIEEVMVELSRLYQEACLAFARGTKLRREGRAPYLYILRWLADSEDWSLDLREAVKRNPQHRGSVGQVLDKGYLASLLDDPDKKELFDPHFHFEPSTATLGVEDPKIIFFLRNLVWRQFTRQVGFPSTIFKGRYDFALSFAGKDREIAKRLADMLADREVAVFYDENEQHRILARNVEEYLGPIYRRDADYIIPLLSQDYPTRIWTKFESKNFHERFGENAVIPIRFSNIRAGYFSDESRYGNLSLDVNGDIDEGLLRIVEILCRRLVDDREGEDRKIVEQFELDETNGKGLQVVIAKSD